MTLRKMLSDRADGRRGDGSFNEAAAMTLRKMPTARPAWPMRCSFNEAAAMTLRKICGQAIDAAARYGCFNEAAAMTLRKMRCADRALSGR